MNGKIVYDKPGRFRFRCGAYAFERELETAIQEALLRNRFVLQVEVHAQNGGILVHYRNGHRLDVIRLVARMNPRTMQPLENQIRLILISRMIWQNWLQNGFYIKHCCRPPSETQ